VTLLHWKQQNPNDDFNAQCTEIVESIIIKNSNKQTSLYLEALDLAKKADSFQDLKEQQEKTSQN
jgi:hypothetical protein